jgi:GrpB-like predicted nucleotidyltransferase (UPF0157 family)
VETDRKVIVVPHDPEWTLAYEGESDSISRALKDTVVSIYHIGSTSIPGIFAKPVIDVLVEATSVKEVDLRNSHMVNADFEALGEFGIRGRRYFRKSDSTGLRLCHVHIFAVGSQDARRHLVFRDFLRTHQEEARQYSDLKRSLAKEFPTDIEAYMDGKDEFIKDIEHRALAWDQNRLNQTDVDVKNADSTALK